jgi:biotin transport system substrate-specific component
MAATMEVPTTSDAPSVLYEVLPRWRMRTVTLVVGFSLLTALCAQLTFHLPWTPVPVTGETFAVLLAGSTLGWAAGAASQVLFVLEGLAGLPFYQGAHHGWSYAHGVVGGYLVGFVLAAALAGLLAERGQDRNLVTSVPAMLAADALIYVTGVPWLAHVLHVGVAQALELGLVPFVIGDLAKLAAVSVALPTAWRLARIVARHE